MGAPPMAPQGFGGVTGQPAGYPAGGGMAQPAGGLPMVSDAAGVPANAAMAAKIASEKRHHLHKIIQTIAIVVLAIGLIATSSFLVLTKMELDEKSRDVDGQIERAVLDAKKAQKDADEAEFEEREKNPYYEFVGPEDYGSLSFQYPKTWSQYVAADASDNGNFEAFFNPGLIEKVNGDAWSGKGVYAIRVMIFNMNTDEVLAFYKSYIDDGYTTSKLVTAGQASGTRLDGYLTPEIQGSAFVFKLRDKTIIIRTDSEIFRGDFDKLINTIKYND
jgi:hypothetical protein